MTPPSTINLADGRNPFPMTAVARLARTGEDFWSIETEPLRQARSQLRAYLAQSKDVEATGDGRKPKGGGAHGTTIAIVGDYGTGKTHIAQEMLQDITLARNSFLHPLYLDAPADTFVSLYRERFIRLLDKDAVIARVDEYYSDIVAAELAQSDLTQTLAEVVRSGKISAEEVVERTGLMRSVLVRKLRDKLRAVTEQKDFATVLLMLRYAETRAAAWEWLEGRPPDPILRERGVSRQINTDALALEAIGVMAFLFGRQGHRFILFIDEMEKVLSGSKSTPEATILAFKKLMEVVGRTRALLVLIGLPEFLEFLPADAQQRVSCIIRPSAITAEEVTQYITEAHRRASGRPTIEPFTPDSIIYLAEIAGGNARRIVRLCYHSFLNADRAKGPVTRAMLREIAREQFELTSKEDCATEISRLIESHGWLVESPKDITVKPGSGILHADHWLPFGTKANGIAIIVTQSILLEDDMSPLTVTSSLLTKMPAACLYSVLVVNGYLADNLREQITKLFTKIVVYKSKAFTQDLESVLLGLRSRLESSEREDVLATLRQQVAELVRQNRTIEHRISDLSNGRELSNAVAAGLRSGFAELSRSRGLEKLPKRLHVVFGRVIDLLDDTPFKADLFENIFPQDISDPRPSYVAYEIFESTSIMRTYLLKDLILGFRQHIVVVFRDFDQMLDDEEVKHRPFPASSMRERVMAACRAYDEVVARSGLDRALERAAMEISTSHKYAGLGLSVKGLSEVRELVARLGHDVFDAAEDTLRKRIR